jgi:tRNA(adenine34) deaminase
MWNDLSEPWKRAFELAWISYNRDTIPIGAVITDTEGTIVSEGRNRIFDVTSSHILAGTYMAHAEMTAMSQLIEDEHPNIRSYILYTTMEPCPMCFGTMLMMHIGKLVYGAHDRFAGATELKDKSKYTKQKKMGIEFAGGDLEVFQLVLQTAFEIGRNHPRVEEILCSWKETNSDAVELGRQLYDEGYFSENRDVEEIYDCVLERYKVLA